MSTDPHIPGREHYELATVAQDAAAARQANGPTGPDYAPAEALADAQVHATLACWEALADLAAELSIMRKQHEPR